MEVLATRKKETGQGQLAVPERVVTLPVCSGSHAITKAKPKVRIVHDLAPEVIKTDIANFRDLVQRLTGKHATSERRHGKTAKPEVSAVSSTDESEKDSCACGWSKEEEEEEEEMMGGVWLGEVKSDGGFMAGLGDMDGFIQSLVQYPQFPFYDH